MSNRPTHLGKPVRHSLSIRLDRALALLDRIVSIIEEGEQRPREPSAWEGMTSRVKGWREPDIRLAIIGLYGKASSRNAANLLAAEFGADRAPTKSALARLFVQMARHDLLRQGMVRERE